MHTSNVIANSWWYMNVCHVSSGDNLLDHSPYLSRRLDALPHAEVTEDPGQKQTQRKVALYVSQLLDARRYIEHSPPESTKTMSGAHSNTRTATVLTWSAWWENLPQLLLFWSGMNLVGQNNRTTCQCSLWRKHPTTIIKEKGSWAETRHQRRWFYHRANAIGKAVTQ